MTSPTARTQRYGRMTPRAPAVRVPNEFVVERGECEACHRFRIEVEAEVLHCPTKTPFLEYTSRPTSEVIS